MKKATFLRLISTKATVLTLLLFLMASPAFAGSRITKTYHQRPLPEVLRDIDKAAPEIDIRFIYNKLEDYTVTCTILGAAPLEAIQQAVGFYPVSVKQEGSTIIVEPVFDTEQKLIGRIVDERGQPLEFANVRLFSPADDSLVAGGVTNANGDFVIPCNQVHVLLKASFIGYHTVERECKVGNIGTLVLKEDAIKLAEVRKNGSRPLARMERGALVYDMPYLLSLIPADNAYEALTRIPGVNEINGRIDLAGQTVTLIINGKATTLDAEQIKERLKQMPAERLAKCEVMMAAPARYHVRGAVINVVTKDNFGQRQLSGQLRGAGIFSKGDCGFVAGSLLWTDGRFSLDAGYSFTGGEKYGKAEHKVVHPLESGPKEYWDLTENFSRLKKHSLYAQMEYAFAQDHRIGLTFNNNWNCSHSHNDALSTNPSEQFSHTNTYLNNVDLSYSAPVGLKLGASFTHFEYPQTQQLHEKIKSDLSTYISQSGQEISKWDFTADQSHSLAHDWTLNYGAEMKITKHRSWQDTNMASGEPVGEATSSLGYTERISDLCFSASKEFGKRVSAEVGVQAENYHTSSSGKFSSRPIGSNDWRVYPTMNLLWKINPQNSLNLSFSSNSKYPSYWSLMSNVFYSNSYSEIWGNPDLKPQSSYDATLTWRLRQRYVLSAFFSYDDNFFVQIPYQPKDRLAVVMQEVNFNFRQNAGLAATAQWRIGSWANGSAMAAMIYTHDRNSRFHDIPFDREDLTARLTATAAIKPLANENLTLILQPVYQSSTIQGVYDIHRFFSLDASLRWTSRNGRLSAVLAGQNLTNFHFQTSDTWRGQNFTMRVNQNWRTLQLSLTYRLGNYKDKQRKAVDTIRMGH